MSNAGFSGFPKEGLDFLEELGRSDKAWFDANKKAYTATVVEPAKAFVVAMGERLSQDIGPSIEAVPKTNGSIAPINNDLRFSPDKSPYKDHLLFRFWDGPNKKAAPTLFIRLSPDEVGIATGAMLPKLDAWREVIDNDKTGKQLTAALAKLAKGRDLDLAGQDYKNVPKPYDQDHPRANLLKHKGFQARWSEPVPALVHKATFVDWCAKRLNACAPIHHWLVTNL